MCVAVQQNVDIRRRDFRRDVDQTKTHAVPLELFRKRPRAFAIAIAADDDHRRANVANAPKQIRRGDVAQVPNFINAGCELREVRRQVVVRVREDENAERLAHSAPLIAAGAGRVAGGTLRTFRCEKPREEPHSKTHRHQPEEKTEHSTEASYLAALARLFDWRQPMTPRRCVA
jgi:hypothetical protein